MRFDILTLFPDVLAAPLAAGVVGRAIDAERLEVNVHNIRDWTTDKHNCADDAPYGGGGGMVLLADPALRAIRAVRAKAAHAVGEAPPVVHLSPQGELLDRALVSELAQRPGLILLCSSYEGVDERVIELEVDREVSIGDYVLTSGELPALVLLNAVARRVPGVLGNPASAANDSFENGLLDFPHYTRPEVVEGRPVPPVLLSGHHAEIDKWRRRRSLERTARRRPDLLGRAELTDEERAWLREQGLGPGDA